MNWRRVMLVAALAVLTGCATLVSSLRMPWPDHVAAFSNAAVGESHPAPWQLWTLSRFSRRTEYRVVDVDGERVLRASSVRAASGLLQDVDIDPRSANTIRWRWNVPALIPGADLRRKGSDDSPVRVIVSFDGDHDKLDVVERAMAGMVKLFSGREMPYATLMYVWENNLPVESVIENPHSSRVRMIVVASEPAQLGEWRSYSRDLGADFKRAFGEAPGKIISVGVMTDSNGTDTDTVAYYGDIVISDKP